MKSSAIVLSDIAASTLGIALFILHLASALQQDLAPAELRLNGEVETMFKSFQAPSVSAREMVSAFYSRTASAPQKTVLIDVLHDRIVIKSNGTRGVFELADPGVAESFHNRILQLPAQDLILFVFNNRSLNAIHDDLAPRLQNTKIIMVPAALRSASPRGGWLPKFQDLEKAKLNRAEFDVALRALLLAPADTATLDSSAQRQSITERLSHWWRFASFWATLLLTGVVVARTERRAQHKAAEI